jgi:hypothetical protein
VIENGKMTKQQVAALILESQMLTKEYLGGGIDELKTTVTTAIQNLNLAQPAVDNGNDIDGDIGPDCFADGQEDDTVEKPAQGSRFRNYAHGGCFWDTPPHFEFLPDMHPFGNGWTLWIVGLPGYTIKAADGSTQAAPIWPLCFLNPKRLPVKLRMQYAVNW